MASGTQKTLIAAGYVWGGPKKKHAEQFIGAKTKVQVYMRNSDDISVIIDPNDKARAEGVLKHPGAIGEAYHNSNMTGFPKRRHTGKSPIEHGYPVTFKTESDLREFLIAFDT